jgi:hypothetical protein
VLWCVLLGVRCISTCNSIANIINSNHEFEWDEVLVSHHLLWMLQMKPVLSSLFFYCLSLSWINWGDDATSCYLAYPPDLDHTNIMSDPPSSLLFQLVHDQWGWVIRWSEWYQSSVDITYNRWWMYVYGMNYRPDINIDIYSLYKWVRWIINQIVIHWVRWLTDQIFIRYINGLGGLPIR